VEIRAAEPYRRRGDHMRLSAERILTTHTGSLPRPAGLSLTGPERDAGQLAEAVRSVVKSQIDAGVDVVNDGEASKVGYSTYVTERLTGFGGEGEPLRPKDYDDFPAWGERVLSTRPASGRWPTTTPPWCRPTSITSGRPLRGSRSPTCSCRPRRPG
jgi:hypothetical protein